MQVALFGEQLLILVLTPSPNSVPSGNTTAARPFSPVLPQSVCRNRSAVSRVCISAGKFFSIPSSSVPPNGGLVTMTSSCSSRRKAVCSGCCRDEFVPVLRCRAAAYWWSPAGAEAVFLDTVDLLLQRLMIGDALHVFVLYAIERAGKKTARTAGRSIMDSPSFGSTRSTIKRVTARGV